MSIDVLLDADVLGRQRTGDETYVENLLRELPGSAPDLRFAAVTRNPDLLPAGVEALELPAGSQELRMAWKLPRLLRRIHPRLGHYQHSLPLRPDGRTVLTVHDLSFEREPSLMPRRDRLVFKTVVPRSARRADRLIAVSDRTKDDLVELYDIPERKIAVIPHGVDPAFTPAPDGGEGYLLFVGAVQRRKDPRAALEAAQELRMPLVVVGPEKEAALARELRRLGADVRGYIDLRLRLHLAAGRDGGDEVTLLHGLDADFGALVAALGCGDGHERHDPDDHGAANRPLHLFAHLVLDA